jgi:hypothetical protein
MMITGYNGEQQQEQGTRASMSFATAADRCILLAAPAAL